MNHRQILTLRNRRSEPLLVRIEPWADEVTIEPAESLALAFEGPPGEAIEVEAEADCIVVYGWVGSTVDIRKTAGHEYP
jgi:hypothetical protein